MDIIALTRETLAKTREVIKTLKPELVKGITTPSNLQGYSLQEPAKQLVPLLSPFQKTIPRIVKPGANSDHWRVITALSMPRLFTTTRAAGNQFATTFGGSAEDGSSGPKSVSAAFKVAAVQGFVDLEAQKASEGFDDALAKETSNALLNGLRIEGQAFMGATLTAIGGSVPTPTVALGTSAGALQPSTTTYFAVIAVLNIFASNRRTPDTINLGNTNANSENLVAPAGVTQAQLQAITCLQADGSTGSTAVTGCGMSAIGSQGTSGSQSGSNKSLKVTWTAVPGATAYAVFVGTTTGAANLGLQGIYTQTQVTFTSLVAVGTSTAVAANDTAVPGSDLTPDSNGYDGIIPQLNAANSGAYVKNLNGTLTASSTAGEIQELQDAFAAIYSNAKIGEFRVCVSGIDSRLLAAKGVSSNSMQIFAQPLATDRARMLIGAHVGEVINGTTGDICEVQVEPWLPQGTILILPTRIPYPSANAPAPFQWVGNYDWMRWDYASTTSTGPIYPFDVRCNGVLEAIFTGGCGLLYNVWKG